MVLVPATARGDFGTTSTHLLSSNRMAETAVEGVVDPSCEAFGHENLYVCDASVLPFSLAVNPALTIGAIAERAAHAMIARG